MATAPPCEYGCHVSFGQADRLHPSGDGVGREFETGVEPRDAIRLAHVEQVDGIDGGIVGEIADVAAPVFRRAYQAMNEQQGAA